MIEVAPDELRDMLSGGVGALQLLDVRRAEAVARDQCALPGAVWRDPEQVEAWWRELEPARPVLVYCVHGHEVGRGVRDRLRAHGLDARLLAGGLTGWRESGGRVVPLTSRGDAS